MSHGLLEIMKIGKYRASYTVCHDNQQDRRMLEFGTQEGAYRFLEKLAMTEDVQDCAVMPVPEEI